MKSIKFNSLLFSLLLFSCSSNDSVEENIYKPVTYKLLSFVFVQQTDTNEDSLSYQIEFYNSNNFEVKGLPQVTTTLGGGGTSTNTPNSQCGVIPANSSCILTYSVVDTNPYLFPNEPIEFVSANFVFE